MKLFRRDTETSEAEDRAYNEVVNDRLRNLLARPTHHDDAETVEHRLRNMVYGSNKE